MAETADKAVFDDSDYEKRMQERAERRKLREMGSGGDSGSSTNLAPMSHRATIHVSKPAEITQAPMSTFNRGDSSFKSSTLDRKPVAAERPPERSMSVSDSSKRMTINVVNDKCDICIKTVYVLEKIEADGKKFHKTCFRCAQCQKTLSLGTYAALAGKFYCKPHFKQLFKLKGNYDEGFGRQTRKSDWINKDGTPGGENQSDAAAAPSEEN